MVSPASSPPTEAHQPKITVISASYYESGLLRGLIENLVATAESRALSFLLCDNTNGADVELQALASDTVRVLPLDQGKAVMSRRHGSALTQGFAQVDSELCVVVDADCRVLCRGWDRRCQEALRDGCVAVGAPFPPWKLGKYHDYPGPHFAFFRTAAIRQAGGDWRPDADGVVASVRDFLLRQLLLMAYCADAWVLDRDPRHHQLAARVERWLGVISKDTGWRIARGVRERRWRAEVFEPLRSHGDVRALVRSAHDRAVLGRLADEFELYVWNGQPMVTHCSRTSRLFDLCLWTGRPLIQIPRFWDRRPRGSIEDWETMCAGLMGAA